MPKISNTTITPQGDIAIDVEKMYQEYFKKLSLQTKLLYTFEEARYLLSCSYEQMKVLIDVGLVPAAKMKSKQSAEGIIKIPKCGLDELLQKICSPEYPENIHESLRPLAIKYLSKVN